MRGLRLALVALAMSFAVPAMAVQPDEVLADPVLESRARDLSAGLRCMVCQNESIDASSAPLARDLRLLVRERLVAGDSDEQVETYLVSRYGEFVLLRPRVTWQTIALWAAPAAILLAGLVFLLLSARGRNRPAPVSLSPDEERRIAELLDRR